MEISEIASLFNDYRKESESDITKEQFDTLFMFFPSLLIVASDGIIDDEEWIYVKYLAKFMSDTYKDEMTAQQRENLETNYLKELNFLLKNLPKWESLFIDTLKTYLEKHNEAKEDIIDILYLFAEASDGLSDDEEKKIEELKAKLNLVEF